MTRGKGEIARGKGEMTRAKLIIFLILFIRECTSI